MSLQQDQRAGVGFYRCPRCKAVWIGHAEFWSLYRDAQPTSEVQALAAGEPSERQCLQCDSMMLEARFDMLQLDQCESHGIWCDTRELERALEGVGRRGLVREFVLRLRE